MFQKTRIQLTILNSLVFIILIGILGSIIYSYTHARLYRGVDDSIKRFIERQATDNKHNLKQFGFPRDPHLGDSRFIVLKWDANNQLEGMEPRILDSAFFVKNQSQLLPKTFGKLQDIEVEGISFRTIAVQGDTDFGKVTFQVLQNINPEKQMLDTLLLILVIGCSIGSICAIGIGFFLAGRALVPITNAWHKQQQFVSDASHELRTPLAVIQSKTDVLFQSPAATIEDKVMDISTISKECRRLSKLVANLLILARSDSDQIEMDKQTFALDQLLNEIVAPYSEIASYQDKTMTAEVNSSISFIGDKERIHQLIVILLDNAMKYTSAGGNIKVSCFETANGIAIQVKDDGIGIAEEEIPKIFDRFYQSDKARTDSSGAGLGLAIANWIVEKHYGKIKVHSKIGEGTCFEIMFPKNQKVRNSYLKENR
ncbi:HAMP domain-containing sensor histidine kinase [Bacillus cereus group sp. BfR-BA-01380]|uniref:sensor histidine kinase n=1 Tax=Bacillus cereus group sp. BfR-BA-01380 TaxID=2920324 RepID=UPI0028BD21B4|nr:HAMP domain-containing sensor histidine kinase [Bacillus cereus group sp. BfR-BA-01380]